MVDNHRFYWQKLTLSEAWEGKRVYVGQGMSQSPSKATVTQSKA